MLIGRLIAFLMTCFTHKKISFIVLSDPLCFEASTEARRIQNTNGPLNWPSNRALWKSNGCHRTDGEIYTTTAFFSPFQWKIWKIHIRCSFSCMILLFEVTTTLAAQVNRSIKASIIEHERGGGLHGWKQHTLPCRLVLMAHWFDCCFSIIAAEHYCSNLSSDPQLSHAHTNTHRPVLSETCMKIKRHLHLPWRDEDCAFQVNLLESVVSTNINRKVHFPH